MVQSPYDAQRSAMSRLGFHYGLNAVPAQEQNDHDLILAAIIAVAVFVVGLNLRI